MKKLIVCSLLFPWTLAGAETALKSASGRWVVSHYTGQDRNHNGRIDRGEWSRPLPPKADRPWAQPQPLQGQTRRWDLKWVENATPATPDPKATRI